MLNNKSSTELATPDGTTVKDIAIASIFDKGALEQFGLTEQDAPAIRSLHATLKDLNLSAVAEFGKDVAAATAKYSDSVLDQVRNTDLDDAGSKLSEIVIVAKELNVSALSSTRSQIPLIGWLVDRVRVRKEQFVQRFNSTKIQIDKLLGEIAVTQGNLKDRVSLMESMFTAVKEEHQTLGCHIVAAKLKAQELAYELTLHDNASADQSSNEHKRSDLRLLISSLDKRIGDLIALQHSAIQSLPMIRMVQANNNMLIEKFHTIKELTVPAWKRQFVLALSLNEQQNAVELAESIDDATNELLRKNAEMLKKNAVGAMRSNQRLVVDIETLEHVQKTLIETIQETIAVQKEGMDSRRRAEHRILEMRQELREHLSQPDPTDRRP